MKIIQVVPSIVAESSGPAYSVPGLCRALADQGGDVELHVLDTVPEGKRNYAVCTYPRHSFPHSAFGRSPEMFATLKKECQSADIIHNHSLWMMPNIYPEFARRETSCKLIISPRGTLSPWAFNRSKWVKKIAWWLGQKDALMNADMLHATSVKEYNEIREFGLTQPVTIIPNGIDLPLISSSKGLRRKLVFLGRLHPVKRLDVLIKSWQRIAPKFPDWDLLIVGPDQHEYAKKLKHLSLEVKDSRITFTGELNGGKKLEVLSNADLFILPSHTENFGMVVSEALSAAVPVICSKGAPWAGLVENNAGWWIDIDVDSLSACLEQALIRSPEELSKMGMNGREWMQRDFSWSRIAEKMAVAYQWLLQGGPVPEWIKVN